MSKVMPWPSTSTSVRSTPGNRENAPSFSMVARLTRQSKSSKPESGGPMAISVVLPPPFFHGTGASAAKGIRVVIDLPPVVH